MSRSLLVVAGGTRTTASTRHRLWNYRAHFEEDGIRVSWIEYGGGRESSLFRATRHRARFLLDLARAGAHDVVLVQKVLPPRRFLRRWKASGTRVVYDFDDALYARSVVGEPEGRWRRRKARFDAVLREAHAVIAGSPPLAEYAEGVAADVSVLYPSLRRERFAEPSGAAARPEGTATVGWVGNDQSQVYLKALEPILLQVFAHHPGARLKVCSSAVPDLHPDLLDRLDFVPWSESGELAAVRSFDVAVSPLGDERWSRARGGRVSVLLSMAAGVPVVATPGGGVGELAGDNGGVLFADDPETWAAHLNRLLSSSEERARLGAQARSVIDRLVWADVQYPGLRDILFPGGWAQAADQPLASAR